MIIVLAAAVSAPLAPALPPADLVFAATAIDPEIAARCADAAPCRDSAADEVKRLRLAYTNTATTPDQRMKLLTMIDEERARGGVDWPGIATRYFAWRTLSTSGPQVIQVPRGPVTTTRCNSGGYGRFHSTTCTTSTQ